MIALLCFGSLRSSLFAQQIFSCCRHYHHHHHRDKPFKSKQSRNSTCVCVCASMFILHIPRHARFNYQHCEPIKLFMRHGMLKQLTEIACQLLPSPLSCARTFSLSLSLPQVPSKFPTIQWCLFSVSLANKNERKTEEKTNSNCIQNCSKQFCVFLRFYYWRKWLLRSKCMISLADQWLQSLQRISSACST